MFRTLDVSGGSREEGVAGRPGWVGENGTDPEPGCAVAKGSAAWRCRADVASESPPCLRERCGRGRLGRPEAWSADRCELSGEVADKGVAFGGDPMSNAPFLLVSAVPLPELVRMLSRGRAPASLSSDFRAAARSVLEPGAHAAVVLADLPRGTRQEAALRVLESLRAADRTLPAALVTDAPGERLIRAAARGRATILLAPIKPAEVTRFANDLVRGDRSATPG